ncbi:MAG: hypothetical protein INF44_01290 [Thalassospira sp.]|nr:hypothetical protein [Thalassospira sp.]
MQNNHRNIDAILSDGSNIIQCEMGIKYQGKESFTVRVNGRHFPRSLEGIIEIIKIYKQEPNVRLDVYDGILEADDKPVGGRQLTTEPERRELIRFFEDCASFREEKKYYLERVKGELREACENISLEKDDKATCDFTLADLRKYLFKRKDIDPSYIKDTDRSYIYDPVKWQIDNDIKRVISALIYNRYFIIEGGIDEGRELIDYIKYRTGRDSKDIRYSVSYETMEWEEQDTSHLIIDAHDYKGETTKTYEWCKITFNEAQIKQVFPPAGEREILQSKDDDPRITKIRDAALQRFREAHKAEKFKDARNGDWWTIDRVEQHILEHSGLPKEQLNAPFDAAKGGIPTFLDKLLKALIGALCKEDGFYLYQGTKEIDNRELKSAEFVILHTYNGASLIYASMSAQRLNEPVLELSSTGTAVRTIRNPLLSRVQVETMFPAAIPDVKPQNATMPLLPINGVDGGGEAKEIQKTTGSRRGRRPGSRMPAYDEAIKILSSSPPEDIQSAFKGRRTSRLAEKIQGELHKRGFKDENYPHKDTVEGWIRNNFYSEITMN